jgi:hypothetical protein
VRISSMYTVPRAGARIITVRREPCRVLSAMEMRSVPAISEDWDEGRFWDRWMIVHWLSGVVGGFANVFISLSAPAIYGIAVAAMVAWEIIEYAMGVREHRWNRVVDVAVGLVGVLVALQVAARVDDHTEYWLFGVTLVIALGLMGWGVKAFKERQKKGRARSREAKAERARRKSRRKEGVEAG